MKKVFLFGIIFFLFVFIKAVTAQGLLSVMNPPPEAEKARPSTVEEVFSPFPTIKKGSFSKVKTKIATEKTISSLKETQETFKEGKYKTKKERTSPSPLEKRFNERAKVYGISLQQIGYNFFQTTKVPTSATLPVARNYILGPGDELLLYVIGSPPGLDLSGISQLFVDREGKIYIPGLGVFYVWGKTLSEAEELLSRELKTNLRLTLGRLRHFPVYVSGEVFYPGAILVSGVDTVVEALVKAGGVKKTGSLREIILTRRTSAQKEKIDLYALVLQGKPLHTLLRDGDVILVPPLRHAVAIGGEIRRPGIYEFLPGETMAQLIELAGGLLPSSYRYRVVLERYEANQRLTVKEYSLEDENFQRLSLRDGDLVIVKQVLPLPENGIQLIGHTPYPGLYEYKPGLTLRTFLKQDLFYRDTSRKVALLERREQGKEPQYISFAPEKVFSGEFDLSLKAGDLIRLFPADFYKPVRLVGCVNPGFVPYHEGLTLREALAKKELCLPPKKLKVEIYREKEGSSPFKLRTIFLADLLIANRQETNVELLPGDLILIQKISPQEVVEKVIVTGQVKRPGTYPLRKGMRLYDLLKEAGGFEERAYPPGIVIFRESVARMQKTRLERAVIELRKTLEKEEAGILQAELSPAEKEARKEAFEAQRRLLAAMEKVEVTGRIAGLIIPENLEKLRHSPSNILLEDGDQIYVPRRPASVLVFGEVNNPSAILYQKGFTVRDYILRAGGFTKYADVEEIFIIRPNGEAFSGKGKVEAISWDPKGKRFVRGRYGNLLAYEPVPGEAIIIPTKIRVPIMWRPLIRDVIQILYQSALTVFTITNL